MDDRSDKVAVARAVAERHYERKGWPVNGSEVISFLVVNNK